ncbi:hypothetical protein ACO2Q1_02360 [Brevundimonas sp. VNH65]|uniref:hypothetical protein n=1 Tax=Brevundimonas sp. VNH65 TaxID=3400917 RepID=UPI003BFCB68D
MRAWVWMTSGLLVWAAHFLGVYSLASLADVVATTDDPVWRAATLAFSLGCALTTAGLLWLAVRRLRRSETERLRFQNQLAALGAGVSFVAICWQALPTVIGY